MIWYDLHVDGQPYDDFNDKDEAIELAKEIVADGYSVTVSEVRSKLIFDAGGVEDE